MEPRRQREAISRLIKEEIKEEKNEIIDSETLLFIDNSLNIDNDLDPRNYKWVKSGEDDDFNNYPFRKWQLKWFFRELSEEQESLLLGFTQDLGIERLLLSVCKILRCIHTIEPESSDDLIDNAPFQRLIEQIQCIDMPYISRESDIYYVVDAPSYHRNMLMSVSRYVEGLIYNKVSCQTFKRIKNNPFRNDNNPYKGFELMYTILNGDKIFQRVREARTMGISTQQIAGAYCKRGSPIPPELVLQIRNKLNNDKKRKEQQETDETNFLVDDEKTLMGLYLSDNNSRK